MSGDAKRAYELGRLRTSARRALWVALPVALLAVLFGSPRALAWVAVTFAAWTFVHWRGGAMLRGAWFGLVGGAVTWALPLTFLRPSCASDMVAASMDCCTKPSACVAAGALVGIALAAFVPLGESRWRGALGMALGVGSIAIVRCGTLFFGEAIGLVGGLALGVLAATTARIVLGRPAPSR